MGDFDNDFNTSGDAFGSSSFASSDYSKLPAKTPAASTASKPATSTTSFSSTFSASIASSTSTTGSRGSSRTSSKPAASRTVAADDDDDDDDDDDAGSSSTTASTTASRKPNASSKASATTTSSGGGGGGLDDEVSRWELDHNEVKLGKKIGKGAFGVVYRAELRGKEVAAKKLNTQNFDEATLEDFRKEVAIMTKLRHPNLLLFMGACTQPGNMMIVTELMPKGSVYDLLHNSEVQLSFKKRMRMAKEAALGMNWLHCSKPVFIHRDLKTGNLLVDENWTVKVSDFGLSHIKAHERADEAGSYGAIGTPLWMAPEVLQNKKYDESADIYSFGIVLWELLTAQDPFPDIENFSQLTARVCTKGERPVIPDTCPSPTLKALIEACWHADPTKRPSFQKMIDDRVFDDIILESIIHDKQGREMWKKNFSGKEGLKEKLQWKDFVAALCSFYKKGIPKDFDDIKLKCTKALLANNPDSRVTIEEFGRFLEWFGPMEDLTILDRVHDLLKRTWFHGEISAETSEKQLTKEKKGTFLVRFSSREPGCYAISVNEGGKIKHYRVYHKPGLDFLIGKSECKSLEDMIATYHKQLGLKHPCPGSQFEPLFQSAKKAQQLASISAGYMTPDIGE